MDRTATPATAANLLDDVTVLDFSWLSPGLYCTALLASLGAQVISVEAPQRRREGASLADLPLYGSDKAREKGVHPLFRSRRSIVVDLKHPEGVELALRFAGEADVLVETFRPGVADRLGIGYEAASSRNSRLVYCSLSGFGQEGPDASRPGHDINYIAVSGLLAAATRPGQAPGLPINLAGDFAGGGLMAAFAVVSAVARQRATGAGSYVDVSMVRSVLSMLETARAWTRGGAPDPSWGNGLLTGACPFYDTYRTRDGQWLAIGALEPKFYSDLCAVLQLDEFADAYLDTARWPGLRTALERAIGERTLEEWLSLARSTSAQLCVSPVLSLEDAFRLADVGDEGVGAPFIVNRTGAEPQPVPSVRRGEHTQELLEELGLPAGEAARLLRDGVVEAARAHAESV